MILYFISKSKYNFFVCVFGLFSFKKVCLIEKVSNLLLEVFNKITIVKSNIIIKKINFIPHIKNMAPKKF